MGRTTIKQDQTSPFLVELADLLALQHRMPKRRRHAPKRCLGSPLALSKIRGRGMDFAETRNYFPGDEIRHMDWRVTARTNKPHVKVFQVERERPVVIINDFAPTMFFGTQICLKTVLAAKLAAILAWTARAHGDRVGGGLIGPGHSSLWLPHARNQTLIHFLKALCMATAAYDKPEWSQANPKEALERIKTTLQELQFSLKPGSLIVFLSDWYYPLNTLKPYFMELARHHDMLFYQIADAFELGPLGPGLFPITDGKTILPLNFYQVKEREAYSHYCQEHQDDIQRFAKGLGLAYHLVTSQDDLFELVQSSLLRRLSG